MALPVPKSALALVLKSAGIDQDFIQKLTSNVESFIKGGAQEIQGALASIEEMKTQLRIVSQDVQEIKTVLQVLVNHLPEDVLRCYGLQKGNESNGDGNEQSSARG